MFLERGEGREKERERNINVWWPLVCPNRGTWPTTQARALTGNPTSDPLVHRPALNPLSHTSQGDLLHLKDMMGHGGSAGQGRGSGWGAEVGTTVTEQ